MHSLSPGNKVPVRDILHSRRRGGREATSLGVSHRRQPTGGAGSGAWVARRRADAQNGRNRGRGRRFLSVFCPANGERCANFPGSARHHRVERPQGNKEGTICRVGVFYFLERFVYT